MYDFFPQPSAPGPAVLYVNNAWAITANTASLRRKENCRNVSLLHFPSNPTLVCKKKRYTEKRVRSEGRRGRRQRKKYLNHWENLSFPGNCPGIFQTKRITAYSRYNNSWTTGVHDRSSWYWWIWSETQNAGCSFFFFFFLSEWCSKPLDYFLICPFPPTLHFIFICCHAEI